MLGEGESVQAAKRRSVGISNYVGLVGGLIKSIQRDFRYRCENYRKPVREDSFFSSLHIIYFCLENISHSFSRENDLNRMIQPRYQIATSGQRPTMANSCRVSSGTRIEHRVRVVCSPLLWKPLSPVARESASGPDRRPDLSLAEEIGDRIQSARRSQPSGPRETRTPCSRWKARSLLRCGRPTDGAVEAFGSARRDSCESVTLRCGGRLKRPPITFHPLCLRARPRPTLLRALLPPDCPTLRESGER